VAFAAACGDSSSEPTSALDPIPLTVFVPGFRGLEDPLAFARLEYTVTCDVAPGAEPPIQEATLEARDAQYGDPDHPADVWRASAELEAGECFIAVFGLTEDGEIQCTGGYAVNVTEATSAIYYEMVCFHPDLSPEVDLVLSAATPVALEAADAVEYILRAAELQDPPVAGEEVIVAQGTLGRRWLGTADLGGGPNLAVIWETTVGPLEWLHYDLEVNALDEAGTVLCRTETRIELVPSLANRAHVVLPCLP
jgi:hypothetical protein